jgi:hypothetical protein
MGAGNPATPAATNIYNPDPVAGTLNLYTQRAQWFNCSDPIQPGIAAITNYLNALPYHVQTGDRFGQDGMGQFGTAGERLGQSGTLSTEIATVRLDATKSRKTPQEATTNKSGNRAVSGICFFAYGTALYVQCASPTSQAE